MIGAWSFLCFKPSQLKPSNHLSTNRNGVRGGQITLSHHMAKTYNSCLYVERLCKRRSFQRCLKQGKACIITCKSASCLIVWFPIDCWTLGKLEVQALSRYEWIEGNLIEASHAGLQNSRLPKNCMATSSVCWQINSVQSSDWAD